MTHPIEQNCPKCGATPGQQCVGQRGPRKAFHRARGTRRNVGSLCLSRFVNHESPIEDLLGAAITEWLAHNDFDHVSVETQVPFGPYRADMMVSVDGHRLVVEADGFQWHSGAVAVQHDKARDRFCAVEGIAVMRFTGTEIIRDPRGCAAQIGTWIVRRR
jgi:very-short-patch-repair endonuclease